MCFFVFVWFLLLILLQFLCKCGKMPVLCVFVFIKNLYLKCSIFLLFSFLSCFFVVFYKNHSFLLEKFNFMVLKLQYVVFL
ncbi:hypothetical protein OC25_15045 [Pedobacter kyungheensis]|uniref:Uncharacterized protein n=1 Tax=Pedobacter kyungheensis TaxID=1069985 RepID=A0A0C1FML5_9SPHI|nr:hypothetical protein OC25_15045 [Pedobacter kyungheensis]